MFQRRIFQWQIYYIQGAPNIGRWYPKLFNKIIISWIYQYYYLALLTNTPLSTAMVLNWLKVDIISDPYKHLLLIVGFYQRGVPLFFYIFQCCCYLQDLPIGNIVSCFSWEGGDRSMDYRHYSTKKSWRIIMTRRRKWNWRVFGIPGWGDFNDKAIEKSWAMWVGRTWTKKILIKVWGVSLWPLIHGKRIIRGGGVDQGWGDFNDENPLKKAEKCP